MWDWKPRYCDWLLPARSQGTSAAGEISFWGYFTATVRQAESAGAGFPNRSNKTFPAARVRYTAFHKYLRLKYA
jgi:hypothetical protein